MPVCVSRKEIELGWVYFQGFGWHVPERSEGRGLCVTTPFAKPQGVPPNPHRLGRGLLKQPGHLQQQGHRAADGFAIERARGLNLRGGQPAVLRVVVDLLLGEIADKL